MKTTDMNTFVFNTNDARRRGATIAPRHKPQITMLMRNIGTIILWMLIGVATPSLLQAQTTETYTFTTNRLVPDGNPSGLSEVRTFNSAIGNIESVTVQLNITGQFNGDLYGYLVHSSGFTVLLNRPGKTASNTAGYADSGLNVTFQTGAGNGDIHLYQNVFTPAAGSPLTGTWQPDGRDVDPTNVTDASPRSTSLTNFNGLNAAGQWTLYLADLESGATNELTEWSLTIVGESYPTLTWANPTNIIYGTPLGASQLNAIATYDSTNVPGTFTYSAAAGTVLGAGLGQTLSVTFTPSNTTTFLPISTNVTINVTPAPLTITANNASKVYGAALPTFTASYSGFVNGDTAASLTTPVMLGTTATASSPVGAYTITGSGAVDANYTITEVNGTLNVTPAPLTITANSASKVYGAALPTFTASYSGFVNGDTAGSLTTPVALGTTATASSPVGAYTITASGAVDANYTIAEVNGTLNVTPAPLTITANNASKVYGAALPTFTASYSGFVNGDTAASLTIPVTLGTTATASSPVGAYTITASGAVDANYTITEVNGTLTVTAAPLTITANNASKVYGAALPTFTASYSGFVNGDTAGSLTTPVTLSTTATASSPVGAYTITASGAMDANYSIGYVAGTLTISQSATMGLVASSANPALPGTNVTFTMTVSPVAPGAGTPTGTVNFVIDGSIAGAGTLSGGVASFATSTLTNGSHTVTAKYAGDPNFIGVTNSLAPAQVVDAPPVATNVTIERYPTEGVKVSLATLLANTSVAQGDTATITVSSTSSNGAVITVTNGWVFYAPASGFTNADSFTYTATDNFGESAVGTVFVNIEVDTSLGQNLVITNLGNGSYLIVGNGIPGRTYRLESTTSLNPADWQIIPGGSVTAGGLGSFQYTNTPSGGTNFYRTIYP
jgi:subtilisin-like proprotein convertase family protein